MATACGVGGGGIYVPLGIILLRFSSKAASGLSQASIFGASVGGLLLNLRDHHPDKKIRDTIGRRTSDMRVIPYEQGLLDSEIEVEEANYLSLDNGSHKFYTRPLIDYDMALFLAPMEMGGAVLGVIIQKLLPNWLFLSLAAVILGLTSIKTFQKFASSYKIEHAARQARVAQNQSVNEVDDASHVEVDATNDSNQEEEQNLDDDVSYEPENQLILDDDVISYGEDEIVQSLSGEGNENIPCPDEEENDTHDDTLVLEDNEEKLEARRKLLEEDARQYPMEKISCLILLWLVLTLLTFLKGGKGVDSLVGITCKSVWYSVLIAAQFFWLLGFATFFGFKMVKRHEKKIQCNFPFYEQDQLWDAQKLRFYASFTFLAGIVAGLIGIGGGMVLNPLMLVMGINPRVSSATTASMIVLTSSSVAVMFVTSGLVPWQYALFFFVVCFSGAFIGKKYIDAYVKRTGMTSILIGILAAIIGLATFGCIAIVILNLKEANWCLDGFKPFCVIEDKDGQEVFCSSFINNPIESDGVNNLFELFR